MPGPWEGAGGQRGSSNPARGTAVVGAGIGELTQFSGRKDVGWRWSTDRPARAACRAGLRIAACERRIAGVGVGERPHGFTGGCYT